MTTPEEMAQRAQRLEATDYVEVFPLVRPAHQDHDVAMFKGDKSMIGFGMPDGNYYGLIYPVELDQRREVSDQVLVSIKNGFADYGIMGDAEFEAEHGFDFEPSPSSEQAEEQKETTMAENQYVTVQEDDLIEVHDPEQPWNMPIGQGTLLDLHDKLVAGRYTGSLWRNTDPYPTDLNIVIEDDKTFAADYRDARFAAEHGFAEPAVAAPEPAPALTPAEEERLLVEAVKKHGVVDMTHEAPISAAEHADRMAAFGLSADGVGTPSQDSGQLLGLASNKGSLADNRYNGLPETGVDTSIKNSTWLCIGSPLTGIDHSVGHAWDMQHRGGPQADGLKPGNYIGWAQNSPGGDAVFRAMFVVGEKGLQVAPAHDQEFAREHGFPPNLHQRTDTSYEFTIADWNPDFRADHRSNEEYLADLGFGPSTTTPPLQEEPASSREEHLARNAWPNIDHSAPKEPISDSEYEKRMAALGLSTEDIPKFEDFGRQPQPQQIRHRSQPMTARIKPASSPVSEVPRGEKPTPKTAPDGQSTKSQSGPNPFLTRQPSGRTTPAGTSSQAGLQSAVTRLGGPGPSRLADQLKAPEASKRPGAAEVARRYEAEQGLNKEPGDMERD